MRCARESVLEWCKCKLLLRAPVFGITHHQQHPSLALKNSCCSLSLSHSAFLTEAKSWLKPDRKAEYPIELALCRLKLRRMHIVICAREMVFAMPGSWHDLFVIPVHFSILLLYPKHNHLGFHFRADEQTRDRLGGCRTKSSESKRSF